jgi:hypothetical protein
MEKPDVLDEAVAEALRDWAMRLLGRNAAPPTGV